MHCDTLLRAFENNSGLYEAADFMVDIRRLAGNGPCVQFFAMFLPPQDRKEFWQRFDTPDDEKLISSLSAVFNAAMAAHSQVIAPAVCADDITRNISAGKVSAVLTMEDGRAVNGSLDNLKRFYDMGVRAVALTWNGINCMGYPNSDDPLIMSAGLTPFGKEAVEYMQQLGMLVDVSHLSDGGFYDVCDICRKPFIASHSNCRALSPHKRNLTDDMIVKLAEHGGVAGLNFCPEFLSADTEAHESKIADMTAQVKHLVNIGGLACAAVGTDFDGIDGSFEIPSCDKMYMLADALQAGGFSAREVEDIFFNNAFSVIKETF